MICGACSNWGTRGWPRVDSDLGIDQRVGDNWGDYTSTTAKGCEEKCLENAECLAFFLQH